MTKHASLALLVIALGLAACGTAAKVATSQQAVWQKFGSRSVDNLFLSWGPPMAEQRRADGARIMSYTYSNMYGVGQKDQRSYSCTVTLIAPPPDYKISDVSMQGQDYECAVIAGGLTGQSGFGVAHPSDFLREHPPVAPF